MVKVELKFCVLLGAILFLNSSAFSQSWSIKADYAESCCCAAACPCIFGSAPTRGYCDWNGLFEIKKGNFGDVNLDGIVVATTASMGSKEGAWIKYTVSENASDAQLKAAVDLVTISWETARKMKVLSVTRAPISVERTDSRIKFSTPSSKAQIEIVNGYKGDPTKILNLPKVQHQDLTQYKTIFSKYEDEKLGFEFSGTNGLTSVIDTHGEL
jgi:hypothetical protein